MKILVTRTDRMGDVILATPVLKKLRELHPQDEITFLVRREWQPILQYGSAIRLMTFDPKESRSDLVRRLKAEKFDRAYVLRDEMPVSLAIFQSGIPERFGPLSTLRSLFLFNRKKFQKRSQCLMHEAEYNLDLAGIHHFGNEQLPEAWVQTQSAAREKALQFLKSHGLAENKFVVIHPGSSGSARYVRTETLIDFAKKWKDSPIIVSGGALETDVLNQFSRQVPSAKILRGDEIGLDGFAEILRLASGVVAHGTGPLHLAAAVGTPTLAIFPPLFVLSERRWGPLVAKRSVWIPDVACPEKYRCRGQRCGFYDCMDLFNTETAIMRLKELTS